MCVLVAQIPPARRRAFTLIETILVVLLVGLLVSLLLPALAEARMAARAMASTSQLRGHGQIMAMYSGDWDDAFPWFADPKATQTVVRCEERNTSIVIAYFYSSNTWNYALADAYYSGNFDDESFYPPGMPDWEGTSGKRGGPTPYGYGCAFIARPEFWNQETRIGPKQWGPTRTSEVTFPTDKTLLISDWPLYRSLVDPLQAPGAINAQTEMCFVDGSAERRKVSDLRSGYPSGDGTFQGSFHPFDFMYTLHTIDGVRGRDR